MRPQETQLQYPLSDMLPPPGQCVAVAPGVKWVRMGLPFALDHINLWLLRDEIDGRAGWSIVDCGIDAPQSRAHWESLFAHALEGLPVLRVIVTHMHPDHVGMAGWLTRKFNCRLWMTRLEYLHCRVLVADTGREPPDDGLHFYRRAGWNEEAIEYLSLIHI